MHRNAMIVCEGANTIDAFTLTHVFTLYKDGKEPLNIIKKQELCSKWLVRGPKSTRELTLILK